MVSVRGGELNSLSFHRNC